MSLSLTTGSSLNVYASYSDEDTLNDEVFSDGNSTISNEYDNPKLFDSELDSQDNFTDQMQNTEIFTRSCGRYIWNKCRCSGDNGTDQQQGSTVTCKHK